MLTKSYRFDVVQDLRKKLSGVDISELARANNITIITREGKINKGWVGQTLDRLANTLDINSSKPDGEDFELKSVSVINRNSEWVPKETIAITMMNPQSILTESFENSALWHKLERMILVGHCYADGKKDSAFVKFISPVDVSDPTLVEKISSYWNVIQDTVRRGNIALYSSKGTSSGFLQLRTKGSGRSKSTCPITGTEFNTRAFYATKNFIRYVRGTMS